MQRLHLGRLIPLRAWRRAVVDLFAPLPPRRCSFQIFKYYEPIKFYFLRGDFDTKYVAASSETLTYNNPQEPTQIKLAFTEGPRHEAPATCWAVACVPRCKRRPARRLSAWPVWQSVSRPANALLWGAVSNFSKIKRRGSPRHALQLPRTNLRASSPLSDPTQ